MHEIQKWLRSVAELSKTGDERVSCANDSHLHLGAYYGTIYPKVLIALVALKTLTLSICSTATICIILSSTPFIMNTQEDEVFSPYASEMLFTRLAKPRILITT